MPVREAINKAGNWASNLSSIGKLLIGIITFIVLVSAAWYQIETNAVDNARQDENITSIIKSNQEQFKQMMESIKKEFKVHGERSDKRYKRAMEEAKELRKKDDTHDKLILDLVERLSFLEGRQYEKDKNK